MAADRPEVPPWRQLTGAVGEALEGVRKFLHEVRAIDWLWGSTVTVTFSGAGVSVPVDFTNGYVVIRRSADIRVFDATTLRGVQASGAGTVTLYVF